MTDDGERDGEAKRARLSNGVDGPAHLADDRDGQRELRRQRVAAAIAVLETDEPERFPDVAAILDHTGKGISKNRVYDEQDLMYAAQSRWNAREALEGRPTRKLRGGDRQELDDWVSKVEFDKVKAHLVRALEEIRDLKVRIARLSADNAMLRQDVDRLEAGIYDELWPDAGKAAV
ncbi:hypothetical protein HMP09_1970 [Sphingomonas sp. HMP9]|uniref:hypothetical protein n=1 Tax=Sphingomonas sp. HMP9 TaxID=1517554 RepID=UPI001596D79E|nr:hypothetical protein [Sphingomonas sp. HMP9]BCA62736.1 hypothetical protein HMP09_1970 [Sphingomonas sp. HMP9]